MHTSGTHLLSICHLYRKAFKYFYCLFVIFGSHATQYKENYNFIFIYAYICIYNTSICVCVYDWSCALNIAVWNLLLPEIVKILDKHLGCVFKFDKQIIRTVYNSAYDICWDKRSVLFQWHCVSQRCIWAESSGKKGS